MGVDAGLFGLCLIFDLGGLGLVLSLLSVTILPDSLFKEFSFEDDLSDSGRFAFAAEGMEETRRCFAASAERRELS